MRVAFTRIPGMSPAARRAAAAAISPQSPHMQTNAQNKGQGEQRLQTALATPVQAIAIPAILRARSRLAGAFRAHLAALSRAHADASTYHESRADTDNVTGTLKDTLSLINPTEPVEPTQPLTQQAGLAAADRERIAESLRQLAAKARTEGAQHVVLAAPTGTGKTLAFMLPLAQHLREGEGETAPATAPSAVTPTATDSEFEPATSVDTVRTAGTLPLLREKTRPGRPRALILSPTRELALQTLAVAKVLARELGFSSAAAVSGGQQRQQPSAAVDLVVGTPGRVLQMMERGALHLTDVKYLVLDEGDTLLAPIAAQKRQAAVRKGREGARRNNSGRESRWTTDDSPEGEARRDKTSFQEEIERILTPILERQPHERLILEGYYGLPTQVIVASATLTRQLEQESKRLLGNRIQFVSAPGLHQSLESCQHKFIRASDHDRMALLLSTLREIESESRVDHVLVFCSSADSVRAVQHYLREQDVDSVCLHAKMPPKVRAADWNKFLQPAAFRVLVCTDLSARGLDFSGVNVPHVINFDFPGSATDYLHRAGRTARAGREGSVTSFVPQQQRASAKQLRALAQDIELCLTSGRSLSDLSASRHSARRAAENKLSDRAVKKEQSSAQATRPARIKLNKWGRLGSTTRASGRPSGGTKRSRPATTSSNARPRQSKRS